MSYLAFALKYRPQNFDQVVGQDHVVSSLKGAIAKKRIHHAYLFSGPRGVGKTSLARILAKSLNCEKGPTPTPCLQCASCVDIAAAKSLDIIEIDGASNRGIDEIRALRENVKLSPAAGRFKVYIIDEVHMLTKEAFNALLKTLEEPPKHIKFIFATTDPHKVLPTILSRCQKFQFNLLTLDQIVGKLKGITKAEKIKIDENLLYTIAQAGEGSIRDAESLLDQIFPVISAGKDIQDIFSFLGIIDENILAKIMNFLVKGDLAAILTLIDKINKEGKDLGIFQDYFLKYLRNFLLAKINSDKFKDLAEVSPESRDVIISISSQLSLAKILKLIDLLIKAKGTSKQINSARIPFELAFIKFLYKEDKEDKGVKEIKNQPQTKHNPGLEKTIQSNEDNPAKAANENISQKTASKDKTDNEVERGQLNQEPKLEENNVSESDVEDDILFQPVRMKWKEILAMMQKQRMAVASHLSFGKPTSSLGKKVFITFPERDKFHKEALENDKNRKFVEDSVETIINKEVRIKFRVDKTAKKDSAKVNKDSKDHLEEKKEVSENQRIEDNFLNELLDTFDGKFHNDE